MATPGHAVGREPLVRQPVVRAKRRSGRGLELLIELARRGSEPLPSMVTPSWHIAQVEQLLVGPVGPLVGGDAWSVASTTGCRRHRPPVYMQAARARRFGRTVPVWYTARLIHWTASHLAPSIQAPEEHSYEICVSTCAGGRCC